MENDKKMPVSESEIAEKIHSTAIPERGQNVSGEYTNEDEHNVICFEPVSEPKNQQGLDSNQVSEPNNQHGPDSNQVSEPNNQHGPDSNQVSEPNNQHGPDSNQVSEPNNQYEDSNQVSELNNQHEDSNQVSELNNQYGDSNLVPRPNLKYEVSNLDNSYEQYKTDEPRDYHITKINYETESNFTKSENQSYCGYNNTFNVESSEYAYRSSSYVQTPVPTYPYVRRNTAYAHDFAYDDVAYGREYTRESVYDESSYFGPAAAPYEESYYGNYEKFCAEKHEYLSEEETVTDEEGSYTDQEQPGNKDYGAGPIVRVQISGHNVEVEPPPIEEQSSLHCQVPQQDRNIVAAGNLKGGYLKFKNQYDVIRSQGDLKGTTHAYNNEGKPVIGYETNKEPVYVYRNNTLSNVFVSVEEPSCSEQQNKTADNISDLITFDPMHYNAAPRHNTEEPPDRKLTEISSILSSINSERFEERDCVEFTSGNLKCISIKTEGKVKGRRRQVAPKRRRTRSQKQKKALEQLHSRDTPLKAVSETDCAVAAIEEKAPEVQAPENNVQREQARSGSFTQPIVIDGGIAYNPIILPNECVYPPDNSSLQLLKPSRKGHICRTDSCDGTCYSGTKISWVVLDFFETGPDFGCTFCSAKYTDIASIVQHTQRYHYGIDHKYDMTTQKRQMVFKCKECLSHFAESYDNLLEHFRKIHGADRYDCCKRNRYRVYHVNYRYSTMVKCIVCMTIIAESDVMNHVKNECKNQEIRIFKNGILEFYTYEDNSIGCVICADRFGSLAQLRRHVVLYHYKVKYVCRVCGVSDMFKALIIKHQNTYHPGSVYRHPGLTYICVQCNNCKFNFNNYDSLLKHYITHALCQPKHPKRRTSLLDDSKCFCLSCNGMGSKVGQDIKRRPSAVNQQKIDGVTIAVPCDKGPLDELQNTMVKPVTNHRYVCGTEPILLKRKREDDLDADIDVLSGVFKLRDEVSGDLGHISCKICAKKYSTKTNMEKHRDVVHFIRCRPCKKMFSDQNELRSHVLYTHSGTGYVQCDKCDMICRSITALSTHYSGHHSDSACTIVAV